MSIISQSGSQLRKREGGRDSQVPTFIRTVPMEDIIGAVTDESGDDITVAHTTFHKLDNNSILELWITASSEAYAGGDSIAIRVYREDFPGIKSLVATLGTVTTSAVADDGSVRHEITDSNDITKSCTHYSVSGTFTVAAGGNLIVTMGKLGAVAG